MEIKKAVYNQLVDITHRASPNEACAFLFNNNTLVVEAITKDRSSVHFGVIDAVFVQALVDKHGSPSALFHSHPGGNRPSGRDEKYMEATMKIWGCIWLIMSNSMDLKGYEMCPMDTYDFGRLVYREHKVEIVG